MPTSTSQNTRIFAPQVIFTQETSRLIVKLKSGEGYNLPSGLTSGDVIRYDPINSGYTLSKADTDVNAEVVGVIESYSGGEYTVVTYGSIRYPTTRLSLITGGAGGGVDVLFLNPNTAGGLTGTIDVSDGTEKIVKPVLQLAPNGNYNGIVLNYLGYKTGNQAVIQEDTPLLPVGSVMYGLPTVTPGVNWLRADSNLTLNVSDYPELYAVYGTAFGYLEKVVVSQPVNVNTVAAWNIINGSIQRGAVLYTTPDVINNSITLIRNPGDLAVSFSHDFYISDVGIGSAGVRVTPVSSTVVSFNVPPVSTPGAPSQGGTVLVPYIKAYEIVSVKIPETITLSGLTLSGNAAISGTVKLGSINNLETFVTNLQTRINNAGIP